MSRPSSLNNNNGPQLHQQQRARRYSAASTHLRYLWMIVTGIVGGFSTFIIYDRMYHSVEVSQLLVVSVDTMNVQADAQVVDQVIEQGQKAAKKRQRRTSKKQLQRHHQLDAIVEELRQAAKQEVPQDEDLSQHFQTKHRRNNNNKRTKQMALQASDAVTRKKAIGEPPSQDSQEAPPMQASKDAATSKKEQHDQRKRQRKQHKQALKALTTTGPKPAVQPQDVVRSLEDFDDDDATQRYKVYFLNETQVTQKDSFSASWLQSKHDFLSMKLEHVGICEDAAFKAWNQRRHKLRMPLDYFDFSVEHLSKWWKLLDYYDSDIVYTSVYTKLAAYIQNGATDYPTASSSPPVLGETIATIAFQPYKMNGRYVRNQLAVERAYNLTIVSLAATIESLRRAEMGRVVVVGSANEHAQYCQHAIDYLHANLQVDPVVGAESTTKEQLVGHLEVAYVQATPDMTRTKHLARNMPRGALMGARRGFLLADQTTPLGEGDTQFLNAWFGTGHAPTHWKYLYLTEPDSILTTRYASLPQIKAEIDSGGIVAPFRLQPIPHESDVRGYNRKDRVLPEANGFETVLELDHYADAHDVCCDEHMGYDHRPGKMPGDECGHKKWFLCGFEEKVPTPDPHRRLRPYQLFRLTKGTGLTTIAGNLFARRCFAGQNAVCRPPHVR